MENHINALSVLTDISVDDMMPHVEAILTILEERFHLDEFSTKTDRSTIFDASSPASASTESFISPATKQKKGGQIFFASTPYEDWPPPSVTERPVANDIETSGASNNASRNEALPLKSKEENSKNLPTDEPTEGTLPTNNAGYQENVASESPNLPLTTQDEVKFTPASPDALTSNFMNTSTVSSAPSDEGFGGKQTSNPPQESFTDIRWHVPPEILNPQSEYQRGQWNTSSDFLDPFIASPEHYFKGLKMQASYIPRPNNFQWNPSPEFTNSQMTPGGLTVYSSTRQNSLPAQRETYDANQNVSFEPNVLSNEMFPPLDMASRVGHNRAFRRMNFRPNTLNLPLTAAAGPNARKTTTAHSAFQWAKSNKRSTSNFAAFLWEQSPSPTQGSNLTMPCPDNSFNSLTPSNNMLSLGTSSAYQSDTETSCFTHNVSPSSTMSEVPNSFLPM